MGYTHYWRRTPDLTPADFAKAADEIARILEVVSARGVKLAGPTGHGKPEITDNIIAFNGEKHCGHRYRDLGSPWPSPTAGGVNETTEPVVGPWFSGAMLQTRTCGGSCASAPFVVDRRFLVREWDQLDKGKYFSHCETAYKPYDLAVTAALVRLKENLDDEIQITSDGKERAFDDAKRLCRELFGHAKKFELEPEEAEVV